MPAGEEKMNEISRDVILDLLPIYQSGDASEETKRLVEAYLESDPALARSIDKIAAQMKDIEIPLSERTQLRAFKTAKNLQFARSVLIGIVAFVLAFLAFWQVAYWFRS